MSPRRVRPVGPAVRDAGSALIMTLMVLGLLTALALTGTVVTLNNLQSARSAQDAGAALNAAEAGVAQATAYLRSAGVRGLSCSPTCAANPWGNSAAPRTVAVSGIDNKTYRVWIERVVPYTSATPGLYRIHSIGRSGTAASREVSADVEVASAAVPPGIFARTVSGGGSAAVRRVSLFSTGCVYQRSKIRMSGVDAAYGIPAAVHSSQVITDANGTGQFCPTTAKPIHDPSRTGSDRDCNPLFPYDQDRFGGGALGTGACAGLAATHPTYYGKQYPDGAGGWGVDGSRIADDASLLRLFNLRTPVLTQAQLDHLRTTARSQDNYHTTASPPVGGWAPDESDAVLFFDLAAADPGGVVDLDRIIGFGRPPEPASCAGRSLMIVIEGGNARLNSNRSLVASLVLTSAAPYGQVLKVNGTSDFIGTIYADSVDLTGNTDVSLDRCFLDNPSPALLDLRLTNYVEHDAG